MPLKYFIERGGGGGGCWKGGERWDCVFIAKKDIL